MNYAPALAQNVANQGRGRDTMLVHMTPREVAGLQALAMAHGGSLTVNPNTGLPEAGFLESILPTVLGGLSEYMGFGQGVSDLLGGAVSKEVGSGLLVGGLTALSSGSLSKGLMAGIGAYGGAGLTGMFTPEQVLGGAGADMSGAPGYREAAVPVAVAPPSDSEVGSTYSDMYKRAASQPTMESFNTSALTNPTIAPPQTATPMPAATAAPAAENVTAWNAPVAAPAASPFSRLFSKEGARYGLAALTPAMYGGFGSEKQAVVDRGTPAMIRPYKLTRKYMGGKKAPGAGESSQGQWFEDIWEAQTPYRAATGGLVSLADGGVPMDKMAPEDDPLARYNTMTGKSKEAYDYLMGRGPRPVQTVTPLPTEEEKKTDTATPSGAAPAVQDALAVSDPYATAALGAIGRSSGANLTLDPRTAEFFNRETSEQKEARMREVSNVANIIARLFPGVAAANWVAGKITGTAPLPDARMPNWGVLGGVGSAYNNLGVSPESGAGWTGGTYISPTGEVSYVSPAVDGGGGGAAGATAALSGVSGYNPGGFNNSGGGGGGGGGAPASDSGGSSYSSSSDSGAGGSGFGSGVSSFGAYSGNYGGGYGGSWAGGGYLKQGGFVVPADVVSALGNGSSEAGLRALNKRLNARPIKGPGDGMSDSIPTKIEGGPDARVANDEAYIDAEDVAKLGGGDPKKGAKKLYALMDRIRKSAHGKTTQQRKVNADSLLA